MKNIDKENTDKKNIGIMTFFNVNNYGAVLQAFALQQTIRKHDCNSEFLNYSEMKELSKEKNKSLLRYIRTLFKLKFDIFTFLKTEKPRHNVNKMFENFRNDYLLIGNQKLYDIEDLEEYAHKYDGVITGSDMVWTDIGQDLDAYFLNFIDYSKRISYAPSITGTNYLNEEQNKKMKEYILGIKYLSCREKEGIDYVKRITNQDATLVVDPTLLLSKQEWKKELKINNESKNKKYILCYMFQGVPNNVKKQLKKIAKQRNMEIRYIPMNIWEYNHELKLGKTGSYGPREFVELFFNASFVVTNSFHGLLFSIISNIPFVVFHRDKNCKWGANEERMGNILKILNEENRFINLNDKITDNFFSKKDYYSNLKEEINVSKEYLKNVISDINKYIKKKEEKEIVTVSDIPIKKCTGCSCCKNVCPKQCIEMKEDSEGFLFPSIDKEKCIKCGICVSRCPSLNTMDDKNPPKLSKIGFSKDINKIKSASGGIFYTIGKYFIENLNGVVYGATLDEKMQCVHMEATNIQELKLMQNSKYIQSNIGNCYINAKKHLEDDKYVLFSGTPCQIAGLKMFLKKDYNKLLTIDLICHGVPSQLFWDINVKNSFLNSKNVRIENLAFRHKDNTKNTFQYAIKYERIKRIKRIKYNLNPYYNSFIRGDSYRKSCYYCKYSNINRVGDITIGDCDSWRKYPDFYKDEVKSTILINSRKAYEYWKKLSDYFVTIDLNLEEEAKINIPLSHSTYKTSKRNEIYKDIINLNWNDFNKKYTSKQSKMILIKKIILKVLKR